MKKVLVAVTGDYASCIEKLDHAGLSVTQETWNAQLGQQEWIRYLSRFDAVIIGGGDWNEETLRALSGKLKMIVKFGVGLDNIDLEAARRYGIAVANAPGCNAGAVAEHTLALMLALVRQIAAFDSAMKAGIYHTKKTDTIIGKTIGLLGFGHIALELAEFLRGFPVQVIACDINRNEDCAARLNVQFVSLDDLIARSDIISLHLPLSDATRGLVDASFFRKMKNSAYIINTSRGAIINEADLTAALRSGVIRGAALDVFEKEPLSPDSELLRCDNVVLSPHAASITDEALTRIMACCVDRVIDFLT